jgi:hypothetical protein
MKKQPMMRGRATTAMSAINLIATCSGGDSPFQNH